MRAVLLIVAATALCTADMSSQRHAEVHMLTPQAAAPRRMTLTTPAPTPLTPIPTPFTPIPTTATPSATPSASPVPTTEAVTTHSQLAAAVADPAHSIVVVEADVTFPFFSWIKIDSGRSVSVVGRSAVDGGRVVFDGDGHSQHFWVAGGTLQIAFVDLVNGTASMLDANCRPVLWKCFGGSILVENGGTLVMRSCDINGGAQGSTYFGNAFQAGGVSVNGDDVRADFFNVSFIGLRATYAGALYAQGASGDEEHATKLRFFECFFLRNTAALAAIGGVLMGWTGIQSEFYDTLFEANDGVALIGWNNGDCKLVRCVFRGNKGCGKTWPVYGSAVYFNSQGLVTITDSLFERNIGDDSGTGAALTLEGVAHLSNVSFLENYAANSGGGAALDVHSAAKVTAINCFALGNSGSSYAGTLHVLESEFTVINSECQMIGGGEITFCG